MRIFLIVFISLFYSTSFAEIKSYEAKGNLESKAPVGCINIGDLSNKYTPADIFIGIAGCIENSKYKEASQLYLAALAYGRYDSKRVEDKSAHQAITVLRMNHLGGLSQDKTQKLKTALKEETENKASICSSLKKLGRPDYHPSYMIQHGMGAFLGNKSNNGLIANFDSSKEWEDVLNSYVKCQS